jgi:transcriptional regulator with XRE-family HTH domain
MERAALAAARYSKGWSQEEAAARIGVTRNTFSQWERGVSDPYPVHVRSLCEVFGRFAEDLDLAMASSKETIPENIEGSSKEILEQCTVGIAACNALSDGGGRNEIALATQISNTYLPTLRALLETSKHRPDAAALLSKIYQHQHGTAYHLTSVAQSLQFSEKSVEYARLSEDVTELVVSLCQLASTYEWPLPPMSVSACRKRGLALMEEAVYLQERSRDIVPPPIQSWIYTLQAKFQALNGQRQEAYTAIGKAQDAFTRKCDDLPGLYFNEANVIRQQAIAYSYLNQQNDAVKTFLSLINSNDPHLAPTHSMPIRTHLSVISESIFSLLKLPMASKDKDLTICLWNAQLDMARALGSETYLKESWKTCEIMECVWPDDAGVLALRDVLYPQ